MADHGQRLMSSFLSLSQDAKDFYLSSEVPELHRRPESALSFLRDWVSFNRPVVIRDGASEWRALRLWRDDEYFKDKMGTEVVTVSVTPNGYADAIDKDSGRFVTPHEKRMTVEQFLAKLDNPPDNAVHYVQKQNSNLSNEWAGLFDDVEEFSWATEAFGCKPDAVNFWMGDGRAVTSTHKDPYENIYVVVRGHKDLILYPPTDLPWMPYRQCSTARYSLSPDEKSFEIVDDDESDKVPWIAMDPLNPDYEKFPNLKHTTPIHLRLNEGDVLYLPSLWFHHLRQSHKCVAVNFWYDMSFDPKYAYFQLLSNLVREVCAEQG